jgi:hypothetical protein
MQAVTGKACRLAFSWIMLLAGYEVTPAEEMTPIIEAVAVQETPSTGRRKVPEPVASVEPVTVSVSEATRITPSQQKLLAAQIRDYGLERERVKAWLKTAWHIEHFHDLSPKQFETLLKRLESWAAQEYAKAEAASALSANARAF